MAHQIFTDDPLGTTTWTAQGAIVTYAALNNESEADDSANEVADLVKRNPTGSANSLPLLLQNIRVQFGRQSTELVPLNQTEGHVQKCRIYAAPKGSLQVTGIYAPGITIGAFLGNLSKTRYGYVFYVRPYGLDSSVQLAAGTKNPIFILGGVTLDSVGMDMQGGDTSLFTMPLAMSFSSLRLN